MIKRLIVALLVSLPLLTMAGDNNGVNFHYDGWAKSTKSAKSEDKPIFVFVRTQTCQRSARMDDIFKNKEVADFFNANFVCVELDPDKPMDNLRVTGWGVKGVPTFLFFNSEKDKVHMVNGERGAVDMVKEAEKALKAAGVTNYKKPSKITQKEKGSATEVIIEDDGDDE